MNEVKAEKPNFAAVGPALNVSLAAKKNDILKLKDGTREVDIAVEDALKALEQVVRHVFFVETTFEKREAEKNKKK